MSLGPSGNTAAGACQRPDDYSFEVINYPFLDGNIPKNQSYGVFISQLVRFARINSNFNKFISDCKNLVSKLIRQSFDPAALRRKFQIFVDKYFDTYLGKIWAISKRRFSILSGRWQAPAAVLPEGPKDQVKSHSRARRAREWLKPASPRARRARGRAKLSRRLPVLLYVFHDSAKNRDFHGTIQVPS